MKIITSPLHKKRLFGFTLIELLVVIAIVGVLAAIGIGNHRRNIARTNVSQEMERFGGAVREVPPLAQSSGRFIYNNKTLKVDYSKWRSNDPNRVSSVAEGSFVWRIYKDGKISSQGFMGSSDTIKLSCSGGFTQYKSEALGSTQGVWIGIFKANQATQSPSESSPSAVIIYRPNGTPFIDGKIVLDHYENGKFHKGVEINFDKMGGINERAHIVK